MCSREYVVTCDNLSTSQQLPPIVPHIGQVLHNHGVGISLGLSARVGNGVTYACVVSDANLTPLFEVRFPKSSRTVDNPELSPWGSLR